ncbi:hypothetical protein [Dyella sp.]|uniref:hypothetical protein n=1 Tax=Dyella sp. TaxID=1869338 RepID=UPI002D782513|nr:hypothetical protein [Dyella sp.]HET6431248.1 hypothetical protein [Dyella sp.]
MKLGNPTKGRLEQGTIFSCCAVDGYPRSMGWGVVITARCDLANFKAPILNYLPIVKLEDWLTNDGLGVIQSRCIAEADAEVEKLLFDLGAPKTVLLGTPVETALETLVALLDEKKQRQFIARKDKVVGKWREAHSGTAESLRTTFPKTYSGAVRELMTHRLSGYYYLCRMEPDESDSCYVVLLRQIGAMPHDLAGALPEGMRKVDAEARSPRYESFFRYSSSDDVAIPLGVIPSPHVEHLLQAFSLLFGRIGLPNTDPAHIDRFANPEVQ